MSRGLQLHVQIEIHSTPQAVWDALTKPELVKKYLFGTEMKADWRVGGKISYSGEWEGKRYEDKGEIKVFEPRKLFVSTYWSPFSGLPDAPENYQTVSYRISPQGDAVLLELTQDNIKDEAARTHSEANWKKVLEDLRAVAEAGA
ncbi:MAG TPA: SRPBCC domain-containing protein [Rectinemataceae bacterium]|nr:SRPBCC domain-containing protein [Rectinemataceae bacterium]